MNHETEIQKRIMVGISDLAAVFRSPAGLFWQGDKIYDPVRKQEILINIRPVKVLVKGYPDLTGYRRTDGRYIAIEVKTKQGRPTKEQKNFIRQVRIAGGLAGIARSVDEARGIVGGVNDSKIKQC